MSTMGVIKFERRVRVEKDAVDNTFGEYPFMLVGHNFITRDQVIPFIMEVYKLETTLTPEARREAELVRDLCLHKLHFANVSFFFFFFLSPFII